MPRGGANIGRASVALPHSEFLDQAHISTVCTRVQFAADACPAGIDLRPRQGRPRRCSTSRSKARSTCAPPATSCPTWSPTLDGQIHVDLAGRIDSVNGGIRTTFEAVPDAPVSKFVLTMQGGKKGLLVNSTDLCKAPNRAIAKFTGHNGRFDVSHPLLANACGKGGRGRSGSGR